MKLPVQSPILPMLAKRVDELPLGEGWIYEPKWDGFRALIFKDDDEVLIQSRDEKSLNRYFPELLGPLRSLPNRCVLDGEIVIAKGNHLDFDQLQLRIHPAASRVHLLSEQTPASVVFFDLLCLGSRNLCEEPFHIRHQMLKEVMQPIVPPLHLTPSTSNSHTAADWFRRFEGAGLDGVIAKPALLTYQPNKRAMFKIKHERDCDCVVAGFRWHKKGDNAVGSLLLGLFDGTGALQHVGICSSFSAAKRLELAELLTPYQEDALTHHPWKNWPGAESRWSQGKDLSWEPVRPELVAEVTYDHLQGNRFRHIAQFRRWRPDKRPSDCTYQQLEVIPPHELRLIFAL